MTFSFFSHNLLVSCGLCFGIELLSKPSLRGVLSFFQVRALIFNYFQIILYFIRPQRFQSKVKSLVKHDYTFRSYHFLDSRGLSHWQPFQKPLLKFMKKSTYKFNVKTIQIKLLLKFYPLYAKRFLCSLQVMCTIGIPTSLSSYHHF